MFCPSIQPRSRSPCRKAWCQGAASAGEKGDSSPIRGTFAGCCGLDGRGAQSRLSVRATMSPMVRRCTVVSLGSACDVRASCASTNDLMPRPMRYSSRHPTCEPWRLWSATCMTGATARLSPKTLRRASRAASFDHRVGTHQQGRRHFQAEGLGGLEVDHQFELRRQNDWQVGRLGTLKNPPGIETGLAIVFTHAAAVADQAAGFNELARIMHRGYCLTRGERHNLIAPVAEERIVDDEQRANSALDEARESRVDVVCSAGV